MNEINELRRVDQQKGFILATSEWKETSLLLDIFTKDYGRRRLVARGARRANSPLRGILTPFAPLSFSWHGKGDFPLLHDVVWLGGQAQMKGLALFAALYIAELIYSLVPLHDPYPSLFTHAIDSLSALSRFRDLTPILRAFEWKLVKKRVFPPPIDQDQQGKEIKINAFYRIERRENLILIEENQEKSDILQISGAALQAIAKNDYSQGALEKEARLFFQFLLKEILPQKELKSQKIIHQLYALKGQYF